MPLPKEQIYTIDDIYSLPEGERAELINGQLYYMAPPSTTHQRLLSFLHLEIANYIRAHKGSCEVFPAPFAVFLQPTSPIYEKDYLEPDLSVVCTPDKIDNKGCHGAPDWIIEIVSPGSKRQDYYTKLSLYRAAGVREYWIVDPSKKAIIVYDMEHDEAPVIYTFQDKVKVNIYADLWVDFSELDL